MDSDVTERRLVAEVLGHVQGVGYRYFVRTAAKRIGVRGWVRNDQDGVVRVEAEGSVLQLNQLLEALRHGPSLASVQDVKHSWLSPTGEDADFSILT